jgi:hypothetical protein
MMGLMYSSERQPGALAVLRDVFRDFSEEAVNRTFRPRLSADSPLSLLIVSRLYVFLRMKSDC